jgi:hypothetical protein
MCRKPVAGLKQIHWHKRPYWHKVDIDLFFAANAEGVDAEVTPKQKSRTRRAGSQPDFIAFDRGRNTT